MDRKIIAPIAGLILLTIFMIAPASSGQKRVDGLRRSPSSLIAPSINWQQPSTGNAGRAKDLKGLIRELRAARLRVKRAGTVSQPFFSVKGRTLNVDGESVQVFEYAKAETAEREARSVDPAGSGTSTSRAMWVGPPHFYRNGRLIVLYVGDNAAVLKALEKALGPQFAGQSSPGG